MSVAVRPKRKLDPTGQHPSRQGSLNQVDLELFQRVLSQQNDDDWRQLFERLQSIVFHWTLSHPMYDLAARHHLPDSYVALAFERFWQATVRNRSLTFATVEAALRYLKACLNGAIFDTLRLYSRPEISFPEADQLHPVELTYEVAMDDEELWEAIKPLFTTPREQRIAYLLFYCGLKPREIVQFCGDEFPQVQEIYQSRHTLLKRVLCHVDLLRRRLSGEGGPRS